MKDLFGDSPETNSSAIPVTSDTHSEASQHSVMLAMVPVALMSTFDAKK